MTIAHTEGIVICSLIFLEDVLKEEGERGGDWLRLRAPILICSPLKLSIAFIRQVKFCVFLCKINTV